MGGNGGRRTARIHPAARPLYNVPEHNIFNPLFSRNIKHIRGNSVEIRYRRSTVSCSDRVCTCIIFAAVATAAAARARARERITVNELNFLIPRRRHGLCARNPIGSIGSRFIDLKLPIYTEYRKLGRALSRGTCNLLFRRASTPDSDGNPRAGCSLSRITAGECRLILFKARRDPDFEEAPSETFIRLIVSTDENVTVSPRFSACNFYVQSVAETRKIA